jgi:hypothetical protein
MHHVGERGAGLDETTLARRARAVIQDAFDVGEFLMGAKHVGGRRQLGDEFGYQLANRPALWFVVAVGLDDESSVDRVTRREPAVLPHGPLARRCRELIAIDSGVRPRHQRLRQPGERRGLGESVG